MNNRDAWLAAIAATLGISEEACRREAAPHVQEVASVAAPGAPSASVEIAPSATATASAIASVTPSASASVATVVKPPATVTPQDLSHAICGAVPQNMVNAACGGSVGIGNPSTARGPTAVIAVSLTGGAAGDAHVATNFRPRFRACANQALARDPSEHGQLVVTAAIGANGDVTKADVTTNSGLSASSVQCMVRMVKNAQFPAGTARTITIVVDQTTQSP